MNILYDIDKPLPLIYYDVLKSYLDWMLSDFIRDR